MNDFTKEELEDLLSCCYGGIHDDHPIEDYKVALQTKLQSLIDSYCEHPNTIDDSCMVVICRDC
jgi:hypothetical protein